MSYLHSKPVFDHGRFANGDSPSRFFGEQPSQHERTDLGIDAALRSVPLPEGLMTRLGKLVYKMSDDPVDQVDWLGC
jgi:hypothetical protein